MQLSKILFKNIKSQSVFTKIKQHCSKNDCRNCELHESLCNQLPVHWDTKKINIALKNLKE